MFIKIAKQPKIAPWREKSTYKNVHSFSQSFLLFVFFSFHLSAPVSRIAKYFRQDGTPLITVGGYTYDFVQNKATCDDEYHMLIRVGLLSFETIADFTVDIMKKWVQHYRISSLLVIYKTAFCNPFSSVSIFFASPFFIRCFLCVSFNFYDTLHTHWRQTVRIFDERFHLRFLFARSSSARKLVAYAPKTMVSCILIAVPFNGGFNFILPFFRFHFKWFRSLILVTTTTTTLTTFHFDLIDCNLLIALKEKETATNKNAVRWLCENSLYNGGEVLRFVYDAMNI